MNYDRTSKYVQSVEGSIKNIDNELSNIRNQLKGNVILLT
jgi:hypothetical protein